MLILREYVVVVVVVVVPASNASEEGANYSVFLLRKFSMFDVWPQIVKPSQSAALSTSFQT